MLFFLQRFSVHKVTVTKRNRKTRNRTRKNRKAWKKERLKNTCSRKTRRTKKTKKNRTLNRKTEKNRKAWKIEKPKTEIAVQKIEEPAKLEKTAIVKLEELEIKTI